MGRSAKGTMAITVLVGITAACTGVGPAAPGTTVTLPPGAVTVVPVPNVGPELVEPPPADRHIEMIEGAGATPEVEDKLIAEVRRYIPGTGAHIATYPDPSGALIRIYEFQVPPDELDPPGAIHICQAAVTAGESIEGFGCGGEMANVPPGRGILHMSHHEGDGDSTMLVKVSTGSSLVVFELGNGQIYSVTPAGDVAFVTLGRAEVTRVTVFYPDGSSDSETMP